MINNNESSISSILYKNFSELPISKSDERKLPDQGALAGDRRGNAVFSDST